MFVARVTRHPVRVSGFRPVESHSGLRETFSKGPSGEEIYDF